MVQVTAFRKLIHNFQWMSKSYLALHRHFSYLIQSFWYNLINRTIKVVSICLTVHLALVFIKCANISTNLMNPSSCFKLKSNYNWKRPTHAAFRSHTATFNWWFWFWFWYKYNKFVRQHDISIPHTCAYWCIKT